MMDTKLTFSPEFDKIMQSLIAVDKNMELGIDNEVKKIALRLNVDAKQANPRKTGDSRRSWQSPVKLSPMVYKITAGKEVNYIPFIFYGKKKKSNFISAPEGITVSPGDYFVGDLEDSRRTVMKEDYEILTDKLEQNIIKVLQDIVK